MVAEFVFSWSPDGYVSNATLATPDGLGGTSTTDIAYSYDDGNSNVTQEVFSVNGTTVGRIEYQFDSNPKVFSGLNIQAFPDRYNTNNQTSKIAYDQIGDLVYTISRTYQYDFDSENCGKPISEMRTENGSSYTINYDYLLTY